MRNDRKQNIQFQFVVVKNKFADEKMKRKVHTHTNNLQHTNQQQQHQQTRDTN